MSFSNVSTCRESSVSCVMYCVFGSGGGISLSSRSRARAVITVLTIPNVASPMVAKMARSSRANADILAIHPMLNRWHPPHDYGGDRAVCRPDRGGRLASGNQLLRCRPRVRGVSAVLHRQAIGSKGYGQGAPKPLSIGSFAKNFHAGRTPSRCPARQVRSRRTTRLVQRPAERGDNQPPWPGPS